MSKFRKTLRSIPLMIARILSAFTHGTLFGVGSVVAAKLVSPDKQASAIAMMFIGVTLANILGVPLGTFIGQGYGWHSTFLIVSCLGVFSLLAIAFFVPKLPNLELPGFQMSVLKKANAAPNLASALNIGAFSLGGAMGAWLGGIAIDNDWGLHSLPWIAALVTLIGLILNIWSRILEGTNVNRQSKAQA